MKIEKTYVVFESLKNARKYFEGQMVIQGLYNGKTAVYVSARLDGRGEALAVYSASPTQRYLGRFEPQSLVDINEASGRVLIAK